MSSSVRPDLAFEPSTDFPTLEDEVPCLRGRGWAFALVAAGAALLVGLGLGVWLGRALAGS